MNEVPVGFKRITKGVVNSMELVLLLGLLALPMVFIGMAGATPGSEVLGEVAPPKIERDKEVGSGVETLRDVYETTESTVPEKAIESGSSVRR